MKQLLISALILISVNWAHADSDIFVCVDANGVKTFGNVGEGKGCKKVDLPGLNTFPAPTAKKVGKAPGDFPKIDDSTQKKRDAERRQILSDELKAEQKKLADLNAQYNNGEPERQGGERNYAKYQERTENLKEDVNRAQQNVDALQREINGLN
ncbi:DUF4124 domain-containing protein [Solimicrobium silvestre]|uniref:DUF4124 domain-containing protein n=1 Tax=Solimicrobium silvestre TaxID=2099400 RepID=A0A2S9GZ16_9BURK|nr:DUF4124 domain-containing protein [Solimicrobium silvestre]PRC92953.1 hypothetical protein S2091_2370 [Solimicrobium silvestre]